MRIPGLHLLSLATMSIAVLAPAAHAQRTGLEDMQGARAGQAEAELLRRGYRNVRTEKGDDRSYGYWWNADRQQCVTIATMNGRYDSITPTTAPDCRQRPSSGRPPRPANRPPERPSYSQVDRSELQRICRAEASDNFDRRPSTLTVNAPIKLRAGYIVQGWFDREGGKRTTFFNCRFDQDGRFTGVS